MRSLGRERDSLEKNISLRLRGYNFIQNKLPSFQNLIFSSCVTTDITFYRAHGFRPDITEIVRKGLPLNVVKISESVNPIPYRNSKVRAFQLKKGTEKLFFTKQVLVLFEYRHLSSSERRRHWKKVG